METVFGLHGASGGAATDLPAATIMDGLWAFPDLHGEMNLSGVFRLHDFGGGRVREDTGSIAFSCEDLVIHDSLANSLYHPINACAHSCLDGCGEGSGVCDGGTACAPMSSLLRVPGVDDDEDDACTDGNNSLIQSFGCHATACACLNALQNSRRFVAIVSREEQSVRVRVLGPRFGFLMGLRASYPIRSQKVCMSRRGLVHKEVSLRSVSRSGNLKLGVLQCPFPLVILISLLCYLSQAVKLEGNRVGHSWRKLAGLGCVFSGCPSRGGSFFFPCRFWRLG